MTRCWVLTLVLVAVDHPQKPGTDQDRARRAAIVDGVMGEPAAPQFRTNQMLTTEFVEASVVGVEGKFEEEDEDDDDLLIKKKPVDRQFKEMLHRENLDRWVFGNMKDDRSRLRWLEYRLRLKCEQAAKTMALSRTQVEKLQLAGRGDIKRFFDRVEEIRPEFDALRADVAAGHRFLLDDLRPLCAQFQVGPFGDDSLFTKTLRKIANDAPEARRDGKS